NRSVKRLFKGGTAAHKLKRHSSRTTAHRYERVALAPRFYVKITLGPFHFLWPRQLYSAFFSLENISPYIGASGCYGVHLMRTCKTIAKSICQKVVLTISRKLASSFAQAARRFLY